ncbi:DMT family transporter [Marinactinospora thermotolerans]|uniref:Drug/metabolite transporter, DME family n=1 Tax=Marinactinospora thermotolerans DSM 45154 TaxID=1122192 RepID=A0A1T4LFK3_9ACTN|nr:DMT family transporter [Marinactinospora thermotolerans]SJZ53539.1 drug/metabolite transporter, DME family [Marinactinospora thermotolerans DSM 45154]
MSGSASSSRLSSGISASPSRRGPALLVTAGLLWGTGGLAGSVLQDLTGIHPLGTAAYRLLVGGLLATAVLAVSGRLRRVPRTRASLTRVATAGGLLALFQSAYFASVWLTSVGLATLVTIGSVPLFVTAVTAVLERRRPAPRLLVSVGLGVLGLALLAGFPSLSGPAWRIALGLGCALAAGALFSALTIVNRRPVAGLDPLAVTALGCLTGGLLLLLPGLVAGMAFSPAPAPLGVLLYLGAVPTALAYLAYFGGLRSAPATVAALAAVLEPLTATLLSVALLGERLSAAGTLGAVLLMAAVVLDQWRPRRR